MGLKFVRRRSFKCYPNAPPTLYPFLFNVLSSLHASTFFSSCLHLSQHSLSTLFKGIIHFVKLKYKIILLRYQTCFLPCSYKTQLSKLWSIFGSMEDNDSTIYPRKHLLLLWLCFFPCHFKYREMCGRGFTQSSIVFSSGILIGF